MLYLGFTSISNSYKLQKSKFVFNKVTAVGIKKMTTLYINDKFEAEAEASWGWDEWETEADSEAERARRREKGAGEPVEKERRREKESCAHEQWKRKFSSSCCALSYIRERATTVVLLEIDLQEHANRRREKRSFNASDAARLRNTRVLLHKTRACDNTGYKLIDE